MKDTEQKLKLNKKEEIIRMKTQNGKKDNKAQMAMRGNKDNSRRKIESREKSEKELQKEKNMK